jgi:glycine dehydrogenase subunit 2
MAMDMKKKIRDFHQAKWDEPVIFELSCPGERGVVVPEVEADIKAAVGSLEELLPKSIRRAKKPALPELGQMQVLKHYLRLSQMTMGGDFTVDLGQGTCTMKYNPKINERYARQAKLTALHPLQDESTVQGMLQIIWEMDGYLQEISGLDRFTFQPGSGSHAILGMASLVQAYFNEKGEGDTRDEIITTIFSHPSDAAAAAVKGYKIITLYSDEKTGLPTLDSLKAVLSNRTAALFITNPEDTGIYNPHIEAFVEAVHQVGGLCGYDQANLNGIMGITRAKEAGFDMSFFNLHKTFGTPHGCGGPGSGALGVVEKLVKYLPRPLVGFNGESYFFEEGDASSIGKLRNFHGVAPAILKAYGWIRALGGEGLKEVARVAVLNNNYMLHKIRKMKGVESSFGLGWRIEQVRYSAQKLFEDTGITTEDMAIRMADYGLHLWSSHHPFVVPQPFTIEPTEAFSKAEIDEYLAVLEKIIHEAYTDAAMVKGAPYNSCCHRVNHESLDDPKRWAITWRMYQKKWKGVEVL